MYRPNDLKKGLSNLWGWRQHHNTEDFTIAESLTRTETGQYFQEVHPLLTLDNVKSIAPNFDLISYPQWDDSVQYRVGDRITSGNVNYRAEKNNSGADPETNPEIWERFDPFSEWLEQKTQASILKAIRSFWDEKMADKTAKNVLENKTLFDGTGSLKDLIPKGSDLVGFEITPIRANGVTTKIERIGIQMTGQGPITLFLMHSSRKDPVKIIELNRIRNGSMEWFDQEDLYLPYVSEETDAGGSWYLVYKQNNLPEEVQAVNSDTDWSASPSGRNYHSRGNIWSRFLEVHPFKFTGIYGPDFDEGFNNDFSVAELELWDITKNKYTHQKNYGINLQISVECDITDIVIDQKRAFQNIIGLQVGIDMLREMAYNPNFNIGRPQQNFSRQEILYELEGDSRGYRKTGLTHNFTQAMEAIKLDTTNMSRICFPCNNKGVRYRTI